MHSSLNWQEMFSTRNILNRRILSPCPLELGSWICKSLQGQQQIALLEEKRKSASETLNTLKSISGDTWEDMNSGMDKALDKLRDLYCQMSTYLKGS